MGSWHYLQWQPYSQMTTNKTVSKLKLCHYCKKAGQGFTVVRGWKRNRSKEMILRPKTRNIRHLNHLHHVLIAKKQTTFQKNVGAVPMPLIDPNDWNRNTQQTLEMRGKNKEIWPTQVHYQFSKTLLNYKSHNSGGQITYQWVDTLYLTHPP